ncbi:MAG: hypothetical protein MUE97_00635 [Phycisphaerales bacterium]|nr:hypothetical protein [Phycisphaerales bacterium]
MRPGRVFVAVAIIAAAAIAGAFIGFAGHPRPPAPSPAPFVQPKPPRPSVGKTLFLYLSGDAQRIIAEVPQEMTDLQAKFMGNVQLSILPGLPIRGGPTYSNPDGGQVSAFVHVVDRTLWQWEGTSLRHISGLSIDIEALVA